MAKASETIRDAVSSWEGIREASGNFGAVEFRPGKREIGHLHGDSWIDVPFPRAVRDELVGSGAAQPHHILPQSGWVTLRLHSEADAERAVAILRRSYDLINGQLERRRPWLDQAQPSRTFLTCFEPATRRAQGRYLGLP